MKTPYYLIIPCKFVPLIALTGERGSGSVYPGAGDTHQVLERLLIPGAYSSRSGTESPPVAAPMN